MHYVIVKKQEGQSYIRYYDVIQAIVDMEVAGGLKPNHHLFIEGLEQVTYGRIPYVQNTMAFGTKV
jgi:hypothetical protein